MKITIDNIAYGGYGVGRIDGKTVFVDYGIPGDMLEIEIYNDKKNFSFAKYVDILKSSDKRVESPCPNFTRCGGCSYLNLGYDDELEFKKSILKDQLKRISGIEPEIDIASDERYHYRSHSGIKCSIGACGFYGKSSNNIVQFPETGCLLLSQKLIEGINSADFKSHEGDLKIAEDWMGNFFDDRSGSRMIEEKTGEHYYRRDIYGFFQSNRYLRKQMVDLVCDYSGLTGSDQFADICAGCGFFTIPLSRISLHGTGYDIDKQSIRNAKSNAQLNNCKNLEFFALPESEINPGKISVKTVIVDPPRSGISKRGRRTINTIAPEVIVYVSCNPSTFARDICDFLKNGYRVDRVTFIDMFPCTHHIEVVSRLVMI